MDQKAKADELISRYLEEMERKLDDPELSLADIANAIRQLVSVYLILHGQPTDRKEIILKLMGGDGKDVSRQYRLVVEETLANLIGQEREGELCLGKDGER